MQIGDVDAFIAASRQRLDDLNAPVVVTGLPEGFDLSDERFQAALLKWNMDRDGQDWPAPRYIPQDSGGYIILGIGCHDRVDGGPHAWAIEVAATR